MPGCLIQHAKDGYIHLKMTFALSVDALFEDYGEVNGRMSNSNSCDTFQLLGRIQDNTPKNFEFDRSLYFFFTSARSIVP
jgi:hypothetical protein